MANGSIQPESMASFLEADVRASWQWLSHHRYTELVALHPQYLPGKANFGHNRKHDAFPKTWYAKSEDEVVAFATRHHGTRMVCYSLNERPSILKNERGFARGAYEQEVEIVSTMLVDIDPQENQPSKAYDAKIVEVLDDTNGYFQDLGLQTPKRAFSGRGYHLLFAHTRISTNEHPDISARKMKFVEEFKDSYHKELADLGLRVDSTQDNRRMVKIYGTAKPEVGVLSRFYGNERVEDEALRNYLLSMPSDTLEQKLSTKPAFGPSLLAIKEELPAIFMTLLRQDEKLRALWDGRGKTEGDLSGSGYDMSLARRLLAYGVSDVSDIATVLAHRPSGSYRNGDKNEHYLRRTIAKALMS